MRDACADTPVLVSLICVEMTDQGEHEVNLNAYLAWGSLMNSMANTRLTSLRRSSRGLLGFRATAVDQSQSQDSDKHAR